MRTRIAISICALVALGPRAAVHAERAAPLDAKAAAREHFQKGLASSADQHFGDALAAFEKAYELAPDYRVLYNVAKVRVVLGRAAAAVEAFEAYLAQGGADVPADRQQEVRAAIATALAHVATVQVRVSVDDAEIRVDGKMAGRSPLPAPVRLTEGQHTFEALLPGQPAQLREVDLPGASTTDVVLTFPTPAPLAAPLSAAPPSLIAKSPEPASPRSLRGLGYGLAGAGLVAVVAGSLLAYLGATDANAARARLVQASSPLPPAVPDLMKYDAAKIDYDGAKTRNELGWALVGVGAAALAGGTALVLTAPSGAPAGLALRGTW